MEHADLLIFALVTFFIAMNLFFLWRARCGHLPYVRPIPGVTAMEEAVGRATEMGRPIVFAMGTSDIRDIITHATMSILGYIARLAARMQTQLITMVVKPDVYPLAQSIVHDAYRSEGMEDDFNAEEQVRFLSDQTIVYAMAVARTIEENDAGCAFIFGRCDFTSLLMTEPGAQRGVLQIAGDPNLGQIPFFVCSCDFTIIGEEFYAASAYVSADPSARGTLVSQDLVKGVLALLIVIGVLLCLSVPLAHALGWDGLVDRLQSAVRPLLKYGT
ncbi:MAG: hypothetical protein IPM18_14685 [Phycisphaerales bacterium]|nr:hypothetical protein [Phycisphaerales bacterium]